MNEKTSLQAYIAKYRNKANVMATIHSGLAEGTSKADFRHTLAVITVTAFITFLGFAGTDRIWDALGAFSSTPPQQPTPTIPPAASVVSSLAGVSTAVSAPDRQASNSGSNRKFWFDLTFNTFVLALFVSSLLPLIYRWKERYASHVQGFQKLREYAQWLDELEMGFEPIRPEDVRAIRQRYQEILGPLPPNSDKDYLRAKVKLIEKQKLKSIQVSSKIAQQPGESNALILDFISSSTTLMPVLGALSQVSGDLWLSGGAVSNYVWDLLTGRCTKVHDLDVVYFDASSFESAGEKELEGKLQALLPHSIGVSVKNQARMHAVNNEPPRSSLAEAIANCPETATAIAVRKSADGTLELLAPHGVADILNMVIRPTPYHAAHPEAFVRRLTQKGWNKSWPEVRIIVASQQSATDPSVLTARNK